MSTYEHPSTLALAAAEDRSDPGTESVRQHLSGCIACRVRAARLQHSSSPGAPSEDAVARILAASAPVPGVLASMTAARDQSPPRPGEIWRVGRDEALLVWVRRVFDDSVDVIPASLDVELADQESVFLPAESTLLGLPLVLLTGVRTHVGLPAMLQRIGYFDASACVREVISAAREGRTPNGVQTGPPIESEDDERIEYRQLIADLLGDLTPGRWTDDPEECTSEQTTADVNDPSGIVRLLQDELKTRHSECNVLPVTEHRVMLANGISLISLTRVSYLDTSIVVVLFDGSALEERLQTGLPFANSCLEFVHAEPDVAAIAISERAHDWPTVVLKVADLRTAFEPPGGPEVAPHLSHEPLPIVDALAKYLDKQYTAWEITEPVTTILQDSNFHDLALRHATDAINEITAQGKRALTPAKKSSWTNLPQDLVSRIAASIMAIMANESIDDVLDALTKSTKRNVQ
jgi:hypothetical protein